MEEFYQVLELDKFSNEMSEKFKKPEELIHDKKLNGKLIECGLDIHQRRNVINFIDGHGIQLFLKTDIELFQEEMFDAEIPSCCGTYLKDVKYSITHFYGEKICQTHCGFLYRIDNKILLFLEPYSSKYRSSYQRTKELFYRMIKNDENLTLKLSYIDSKTKCIDNKKNQIFKILLVNSINLY